MESIPGRRKKKKKKRRESTKEQKFLGEKKSWVRVAQWVRAGHKRSGRHYRGEGSGEDWINSRRTSVSQHLRTKGNPVTEEQRNSLDRRWRMDQVVKGCKGDQSSEPWVLMDLHSGAVLSSCFVPHVPAPWSRHFILFWILPEHSCPHILHVFTSHNILSSYPQFVSS